MTPTTKIRLIPEPEQHEPVDLNTDLGKLLFARAQIKELRKRTAWLLDWYDEQLMIRDKKIESLSIAPAQFKEKTKKIHDAYQKQIAAMAAKRSKLNVKINELRYELHSIKTLYNINTDDDE